MDDARGLLTSATPRHTTQTLTRVRANDETRPSAPRATPPPHLSALRSARENGSERKTPLRSTLCASAARGGVCEGTGGEGRGAKRSTPAAPPPPPTSNPPLRVSPAPRAHSAPPGKHSRRKQAARGNPVPGRRHPRRPRARHPPPQCHRKGDPRRPASHDSSASNHPRD